MSKPTSSTLSADQGTAPNGVYQETLAEAQARRALHIVGAVIVVITVIAVIWGVSGGQRWALKRQRQAMQMAARADLQLVFDAEQVFFAKNGFYTTDLKALNLWPKRVIYAFGFTKPSNKNEMGGAGLDPEMRTIARLAKQRAEDAVAKAKADPNFKPDAPIVLSPVTGAATLDFTRLISYCPDCTATATGFKIIAAANLDDDPVLDIWVMDHKGSVQHLLDDLH